MTNTLSFKHVLHVGPNYIRHKGGMGAVIETYEKNVADFEFVASYEGNYNSILNVPFFAVSFLKILGKLIQKREIKIIHIHGASFGSFYRKYLIFLTGKYCFNKKVIYHLHAAEFHTFYENSNFIGKKLIAHLINQSDSIIVLSQSWKEFITSKFTPQKVSILNNPIEIPEVKAETPEFRGNKMNFLFLGRIGDRKGLFDLMDVIAANAAYYREKASFVIGGDGEVDKLKSYIGAHGLQDIVAYAGWVDGDLKRKLLNQCDVLLLPSYNEGLPIAILEAMSYGKPIIASNVGGIPEVVRNGQNGYTIDPGDKDALNDRMKRLIEDQAQAKAMGLESARIIGSHDIKKVLKDMQSVYNAVLV
jgi:glycosyltransferase involved in cell wall biosynthesis